MTEQPKAAPFTAPDGMKKILLRRREVESIIGFSRSRLYGLMKLGRFPRPVKLSPGRQDHQRRVGRPESETQRSASGVVPHKPENGPVGRFRD